MVDCEATTKWYPAEKNIQSTPYPWIVLEVDLATIDEDVDYRDYGQLILRGANEHFDNEIVSRALWCGFSGNRTLRNAAFDQARRRTYAVNTPELAAASMPNPLVYAFRGGSLSIPTVAMFSSEQLHRFDFGTDIIGKLYDLKEGVTSLDLATHALFVFRDKAMEDEIAS